MKPGDIIQIDIKDPDGLVLAGITKFNPRYYISGFYVVVELEQDQQSGLMFIGVDRRCADSIKHPNRIFRTTFEENPKYFKVVS